MDLDKGTSVNGKGGTTCEWGPGRTCAAIDARAI